MGLLQQPRRLFLIAESSSEQRDHNAVEKCLPRDIRECLSAADGIFCTADNSKSSFHALKLLEVSPASQHGFS